MMMTMMKYPQGGSSECTALMLCIVINPFKGGTLVPSLQSRRRAGQELFSYCVLIPLSAQRCLSPELQCQAAKLSASLSIYVIWSLIERHVRPVNLINIVSPRQPFLLLPLLSLSLSLFQFSVLYWHEKKLYSFRK